MCIRDRAAGLQTGANVIYCQQCIVIEMKVGQALRDACFEHLQRLPLSFFNVTPVGYLVARVMSDTNQLGSIFSWRLAEFVWNGCYLIFVVISMFLLSWRLALLVLIVVPPIALVCSFFQRRLLRANRRVRRANSTLTASFNENISGAKTIKTLAVEDTVCREFREINLDMRRKAMHAKTLHALFQPLVMFLGSVSLALVMAAGGVMVGPWGIPLGTPVSYTHLDVYKRQGMPRGWPSAVATSAPHWPGVAITPRAMGLQPMIYLAPFSWTIWPSSSQSSNRP